ncbi:DNA helicase RecG, partial [Phormidium pseudopriestleyi FRX01]|nr:DNA helicase RecG [Phormidium pseudopriestleyi FRX01]
MKAESLDWGRLQKALSVESQRGFTDVVGSQYCFSEFLQISLKDSPANLVSADIRRWQTLAAEFGRYPEMTLEKRQALVSDTRRFLLDMERICTKTPPSENGTAKQHRLVEQPPTSPGRSPSISPRETLSTTPSTTPVSLNQGLSQVSGIGSRNADKLAKLGLYTLYDLLYNFPRDH